MAHADSVVCLHQRPLTVFASPGRYMQGPGATHELGRELKRLGLAGPVVLIAGGTAQRDLQPIWNSVLPAEGITPLVMPFGGSAVGKKLTGWCIRPGAAARWPSWGPAAAKPPTRPAPWRMNWTCRQSSTPTLASTDSPCSALSVMYGAGGKVEGFRFYNRHPLLVLVDTTVVARAPKRQLVGGLGDALATWFEARTVREGAPRARSRRSTATRRPWGCRSPWRRWGWMPAARSSCAPSPNAA